MKAKIKITPKRAVLDPQGVAVRNALRQMGYVGVGDVHVGRYIEVELDASDADEARQRMEEACRRFLSNPVIEDFELDLEVE